MLSRKKAIQTIYNKHGNTSIYITTTGYISRAMYNMYPSNKNIFYMQGSMGLSPCIGLGMALNTSKDIVVLSGDAALLMHLGITHTIRDAKLDNLFIYILDNGCHESVGGFACAALENSYPGVTEIIKINREGKNSRVQLSCLKNVEYIKKELRNK